MSTVQQLPFPYALSRSEQQSKLDTDFDVVIVGGGITGAGALRDAAARGLRALLIERQDFASGTSSRSTKLVHGGLRYLEQFAFGLVFESLAERTRLRKVAPHLVVPMPFVFPVYRGDRVGLLKMRLGVLLYETLSLFRTPGPRRYFNRRQIEQAEPMLNLKNLEGAPAYFDCAVDDARLVLENIVDGVALGGVALNYCEFVSVSKNATNEVTGVVIREDGHPERLIRTKTVIIAAGPFTDSVLNQPEQRWIKPTKGVHIVVPHRRLPITNAVVCLHPLDGRVMFAIPWGDSTYLGTTDTDIDESGAEASENWLHATQADVVYLLAAATHYFPSANLSMADVVSTWAGLRPLLRPKDATLGASARSREHRIEALSPGFVVAAGGKLTTFAPMAEEAVTLCAEHLGQLAPHRRDRLRFLNRPFPGAHGYSGSVAPPTGGVDAGAVPNEVWSRLRRLYGGSAARLATIFAGTDWALDPYISEAEVLWASRYEMARTVEDILVRRTQVYFRSPDQGAKVASRVGRLLAQELGKPASYGDASAEAYMRLLEVENRWRTAPRLTPSS